MEHPRANHRKTPAPLGGPDSNIKAGRYRLPRSFTERLKSRLEEKIERLDPSRGGIHSQTTWGKAWDEIFEYLWREGATTSPRVIIEPPHADEPPHYSLRLFQQVNSLRSDGGPTTIGGYARGVSLDPAEAVSKVIGEFLERYPLTIYRRKDLLFGSVSHLMAARKHFLNPCLLAGFAEWQKTEFPHFHYDEESIFGWIECENLTEGKRMLAPAQLIFWNYSMNSEPREPLLRQPTTSGAGGHFTTAEATASAIYELIQRDGFLVAWLNKITPPRIDHQNSQNGELKKLIRLLEEYEYQVVFVNTRFDLPVPSCFAVLIEHSTEGSRAYLGGGTDANIERAMIRALTESISIHHWIKERSRQFVLPESYRPFRDARIGPDERAKIWSHPKMFPELSWFISGRSQSIEEAQGSFPRSFSSPEKELEALLALFRELGPEYSVIRYETRHPLLRHLGYHSVKAVIPALIPFYLREIYASLGARRLQEVPETMGLSRSHDWNPLPHPFP